MTSQQLTRSSLTPRAERAIRRASTAAVSFVAFAAAVLSFSGLYDLAVAAGFPTFLAPLFPLATDLAVGAFSLAVLHHRMVGLRAWWPWLCMMLGVGVSIAGNVWSAPDDLVSRLVHAWPPLIFALSFETLTRLVRHRILTHQALELDSTPEPEAAEVPQAGPIEVDPQEQTEDLDPAEAPKPAPSPQPAQESSERTPAQAPPQKAEPETKPEPEPQPRPTRKPKRSGTVREQIIEILTDSPDTTAAQIARDLDRDRSYVSKIVREVRKELQTQQAQPTPATEEPAPAGPEPAAQEISEPAPAGVEEVAVSAPAEVVPFPEAPPRLVVVAEAKNAVFEASGQDPARSASVWSRLGLPSESDAMITQAQLDEALEEVRAVEVAGVR